MNLIPAVISAAFCGVVFAQVHPVTLEKSGEGWRLLRDGQPYFVKGGGGTGDLELLRASGGNSIRLWGADNAGRHLDAAEKLGLTVTVGIWLGHERHGFSYNNPADIAKLLAETRRAAAAYKDHPALLMWGVGNEMEAEKPDNAAIWMAVNAVAAEIKKIDKNHPTMVVVAEIGETKLRHIADLCPDIDIVGVNSYGGAGTLPARYRAKGAPRPYLLTEYGPAGHWESPKADWGASLEPSSTEKGPVYRRVYQDAVLGAPGLCLGSYAFLWGHKQEATLTWFGCLLPDGSRLAAADALRELWAGSAPPNRVPVVESLSLDGDPHTEPGATLHATLVASDPEKDALAVEWVLTEEQARYAGGGDATPPLRRFPAAVRAEGLRATITVPEEKIAYRLYAFVRDGKGGAATANIPLTAGLRRAGVKPAGEPVAVPLTVLGDGVKEGPYAPTGWMGNTKALGVDADCREGPHSGVACLRLRYIAEGEWAAVAWQSPANDWGDKPGGLNLSRATRLTVWARGGEGGEKVEFKVGMIEGSKPYPDSARASAAVTLTKEWAPYTVELKGLDLGCIKTGLVVSFAGQGRVLTVDLDDARFE